MNEPKKSILLIFRNEGSMFHALIHLSKILIDGRNIPMIEVVVSPKKSQCTPYIICIYKNKVCLKAKEMGRD